MKKYKFLLSDESVNSYGARVLTAGIRLGNYEKNPIVLWNHTRAPWSTSANQILPIGKCVKVWKEGNKLYGEVAFDTEDEFAKKIASKVEQGILSAVSIGIGVITTSDDASVIVPGQRRPSIIESELREWSIVDIGANKNAVRLMDDTGQELNFNDNSDNFLLPILNTGENMNFKDSVIDVLSLSGKSDDEIIARLRELQNGSTEIETLRGQNSSLTTELQTYKDQEIEKQTQRVVSLVDGAIKDKKILASEKESYTALAEKDFENTEVILKNKVAVQELGDTGQPDGVASDPWEERFSQIDENVKKRNH